MRSFAYLTLLSLPLTQMPRTSTEERGLMKNLHYVLSFHLIVCTFYLMRKSTGYPSHVLNAEDRVVRDARAGVQPLRTGLLLFQPLLLLHFLPSLLCLFANAFDSLYSLSLFVHVAAFQDPLNDLTGIDCGEIMLSNLLVYSHRLGCGVRVVCERHETCGSVVDSIWSTPRSGGEVCTSWREGSSEND